MIKIEVTEEDITQKFLEGSYGVITVCPVTTAIAKLLKERFYVTTGTSTFSIHDATKRVYHSNIPKHAGDKIEHIDACQRKMEELKQVFPFSFEADIPQEYLK